MQPEAETKMYLTVDSSQPNSDLLVNRRLLFTQTEQTRVLSVSMQRRFPFLRLHSACDRRMSKQQLWNVSDRGKPKCLEKISVPVPLCAPRVSH